MTSFFVFLLVLLLLVLFFYTWYRLHKELHMHVSSFDDSPEKYNIPFEKKVFTTEDNIKLVGWYMPVVNAKAVVVMVHGRKKEEGGKSLFLGHADYLRKAGYSVFLFDMRSVGESEGKKITMGVKEWMDVVAAYNEVAKLPENKGKKIGLYGISMGASTALIATGKEKIGDFVIASVPYASFARLFGYQVFMEKLFPKFIFTFFLRIAAIFELGVFYELYSPLHVIPTIHAPIFLMSAKKDTMVNPKDAWLLYEKANKPKEYWEVNAPHDIHGSLQEEFENKALEFLERYAV